MPLSLKEKQDTLQTEDKMRLKLLLLLLLLLPLVRAEIMISQPKLIYNLGDNLGMSIEISEIKVGYLEVNLECGSSMLIDRSTPSSTKKDINLPLTPSYIGELRGNCYVSASYGGETARSPAFIAPTSVSPDVLVSLPTAIHPFRMVPSASPIWSTRSGVMSLPIIPRTPFVPNNRFCFFSGAVIV